MPNHPNPHRQKQKKTTGSSVRHSSGVLPAAAIQRVAFCHGYVRNVFYPFNNYRIALFSVYVNSFTSLFNTHASGFPHTSNRFVHSFSGSLLRHTSMLLKACAAAGGVITRCSTILSSRNNVPCSLIPSRPAAFLKSPSPLTSGIFRCRARTSAEISIREGRG